MRPPTPQQRAHYRARRYLERVNMMLEDKPYPDTSIIGYLLLAAGELWIGTEHDPQEFTAQVQPIFRQVKENVLLLPLEKNRPPDLHVTHADLSDSRNTTRQDAKSRQRRTNISHQSQLSPVVDGYPAFHRPHRAAPSPPMVPSPHTPHPPSPLNPSLDPNPSG